MRTYANGMKSTEITRKQIGVIYGKAKNGELTVEKWIMSDFYNMADYYGYDDNRGVEENEFKIKMILEDVFAGDIEEAQKKVDDYTEFTFDHLGRKSREKIDRTLFV